MGRWLTWKKGQGCLFLEVTLLGDESPDSAPILLAWCNGVMAWGGGGRAGAGHEPGHSSTHCCTCLDKPHKANLDGREGFRAARRGPGTRSLGAGRVEVPAAGGGGWR